MLSHRSSFDCEKNHLEQNEALQLRFEKTIALYIAQNIREGAHLAFACIFGTSFHVPSMAWDFGKTSSSTLGSPFLSLFHLPKTDNHVAG